MPLSSGMLPRFAPYAALPRASTLPFSVPLNRRGKAERFSLNRVSRISSARLATRPPMQEMGCMIIQTKPGRIARRQSPDFSGCWPVFSTRLARSTQPNCAAPIHALGEWCVSPFECHLLNGGWVRFSPKADTRRRRCGIAEARQLMDAPDATTRATAYPKCDGYANPLSYCRCSRFIL